MSGPALELRDVTKTYGSGASGIVTALSPTSLTIEAGEFCAIVGSSGAGKSTLLNILGCLDRPSGGSVLISGIDVLARTERQIADIRNAEIGFVFQSFNLIPTLTALGNVELPMVYGRVPRAERRERALEALDRVGLASRAGHRPNQLSGGQQQRVAVARAIVNRPAFILADEPTGNLDSTSTADVLELVEELNRDGVTVVLITHEDDVAARASRVVVMSDGRIDRVYSNERVAS